MARTLVTLYGHGRREPLTEYNRPTADAVRVSGPPVIYEGTFVMSQTMLKPGSDTRG